MLNMKGDKKRREMLFTVILLAVSVWYYFFLGESGYVLYRDSQVFIEGNLSGYIAYVGFLKICRIIFGQELYLYAVFVIQSLIAMAVSFIITKYFKQHFSLGYVEAMFVYVCTLLPYGYSLPEEVVTHHIVTEGLSFSVFHLCLLFIMISFLERKIYMMLPAGIAVVILMLLRTQMALMLIIYTVLWGIILLEKLYQRVSIKYRKAYWGALIGIVLLGCMLIPSIMVGIVNSEKLPQFTDAISGRVLCTIEQENREYIDEEYRGLFDFVYAEVDERKQREPYFRKDWHRWEDIVYSTNENTKMFGNLMQEYSEENSKEYGRDVYTYLTVKLFKCHLWEYFKMTGVLCMQSLVVSIFIQPASIYELCWSMAFVIYIVTILLLIYSKRMGSDSQYRIPMLVTGIALLGNAVITNIFFCGLQRYVVYTFGFFYIALFLLIKGIFIKRIKR